MVERCGKCIRESPYPRVLHVTSSYLLFAKDPLCHTTYSNKESWRFRWAKKSLRNRTRGAKGGYKCICSTMKAAWVALLAEIWFQKKQFRRCSSSLHHPIEGLASCSHQKHNIFNQRPCPSHPFCSSQYLPSVQWSVAAPSWRAPDGLSWLANNYTHKHFPKHLRVLLYLPQQDFPLYHVLQFFFGVALTCCNSKSMSCTSWHHFRWIVSEFVPWRIESLPDMAAETASPNKHHLTCWLHYAWEQHGTTTNHQQQQQDASDK